MSITRQDGQTDPYYQKEISEFQPFQAEWYETGKVSKVNWKLNIKARVNKAKDAQNVPKTNNRSGFLQQR